MNSVFTIVFSKWRYFAYFLSGALCTFLILGFIVMYKEHIKNVMYQNHIKNTLPSASQKQIIIPIRFDRRRLRPVVNVLINGRKAKLLLDTGSSITFLSPRFWNKMKNKDTMKDIISAQPLHQVTIQSIEKTWFIKQAPIMRDSSLPGSKHLRDLLHVDGELSPQSLGGTCTVIDFIHNTMTVNYGDTPKSCNPPSFKTAYSQQSKSKQGIYIPLLQIHNKSGSESGLALMDTGSSNSLFSSTLISPLSIIKGKYIGVLDSNNKNTNFNENARTTIIIGRTLIMFPVSGVFYSQNASSIGMDVLQNAKIFLHKSGLIQLQFKPGKGGTGDRFILVPPFLAEKGTDLF